MAEHRKLHRLSRIWLVHPVYFITVCTKDRRQILIVPNVADILRREWEAAKDRYGWLIGRYAIMPDHVHFFCAEKSEGATHSLSRFMAGWKEWTAKNASRALATLPPIWQEQFFDHVMRSDESYAEKWDYVRMNPVRAGLAAAWEDWPYQGFVDFDFPKATKNGTAARVSAPGYRGGKDRL